MSQDIETEQMHQVTFFITTQFCFNQKQRNIYKHTNHERRMKGRGERGGDAFYKNESLSWMYTVQ